MNYESLVENTDRMIREIMRREQIWMYVLMAMAAILMVLVVIMSVQTIKEHRRNKTVKVVGGYTYKPQVTETVQVKDGVVYHRMGVPYQ